MQSNTYKRTVHIKLRTTQGEDRSYRKVQGKAAPRLTSKQHCWLSRRPPWWRQLSHRTKSSQPYWWFLKKKSKLEKSSVLRFGFGKPREPVCVKWKSSSNEVCTKFQQRKYHINERLTNHRDQERSVGLVDVLLHSVVNQVCERNIKSNHSK